MDKQREKLIPHDVSARGENYKGGREQDKKAELLSNVPQYGKDASGQRLARLKTRRKLWLKVHLWLGLSAGVALALIGLTGSILVFWQELDAGLNPSLHHVEAPPQGRAAYLPLGKLVVAADSVMPPGARHSTIYYPRHEGLALWFFYEKPVNGKSIADIVNVFVDPYTGRIVGTRKWSDTENSIFCWPLLSFIFELHYDLLLGWDSGSPIVGIIGIMAFLSTLTGLIVWWPLTGQWRQALTFKQRASVERFNYDLHKIFGVYSVPVLLAVLISGVYFNFGDQFRWLANCFSSVTPVKQFKSKLLPNTSPLSIDLALNRANSQYPEGQLYWFTVPDTPDGVYVLTKHYDFGGIFMGRRQIVLDQYSGDILHVADPLVGTGGNVFLQWQWALHSGQALRMPGRILVLLSGFACFVLFVTGLIRWLQKRRTRKVTRNKQRTIDGPIAAFKENTRV
jgi:uncharacterized iron-regulated membrane protein